MSDHKAVLKPGSVKRNPVSGGFEFVMVCCGEFEASGHIMDLSKYANNEERQARIDLELADHAAAHAAEMATHEFLEHYANGYLTDCPNCK